MISFSGTPKWEDSGSIFQINEVIYHQCVSKGHLAYTSFLQSHALIFTALILAGSRLIERFADLERSLNSEQS